MIIKNIGDKCKCTQGINLGTSRKWCMQRLLQPPSRGRGPTTAPGPAQQAAASRRPLPPTCRYRCRLSAKDTDGARAGSGSEPTLRWGLLRSWAVRMQVDAGQGF